MRIKNSLNQIENGCLIFLREKEIADNIIQRVSLITRVYVVIDNFIELKGG